MAFRSTTDDWQMNKSVLESNKYVLENQLFCDVKFVFPVEDKKQDNVISAHKFVLITRSPVFCAMFTGPAKDENPEIRIEDVDKESFMEMLRYMYTEEADLTVYNVLSVLYCAKKYMITGLQTICRDYLEKQIDHSNVCFILEQASIMEEKELEKKCLEILDDEAEEALKSEAFTKISSETVEKILKTETLLVKEVHVYKACIKWADAECQRQGKQIDDTTRRETLGNLRYLIRFPVMDQEEFYSTVCTSKVLTPEEILDVTLCMKNLKPHNEMIFSGNSRAGDGSRVDCFFEGLQMTQSNYFSIGKQVTVNFRITYSSGQIYVSSVYFIDRHRGNMAVSIQSQTNVFSGTVRPTEKLHDLKYIIYEAMFDPPIPATSNQKVSVIFSLPGQLKAHTPIGGRKSMFQYKKFEVEMPTSGWHNMVGLKIKRSLH